MYDIITDHFSEEHNLKGTLYRYECTALQKQRLDKVFASLLPELSRTRFQKLLDEGCVTIDGQEIDSASSKMHPGLYEVFVPDAAPAEPQPQNIPLDIVYEDDDLVVIDKPAGLVMHPAAGNPDGTLVNALLYHCGDSLSGIGGVMRPGIVHRLDKDTSGLIVVAKNDVTHRDLSEQFSSRTVERAYKALVWGRVIKSTGQIESYIGRDPHHRQRMANLRKGGRYALTLYQVERYIESLATLVECRLKTGRTHQIRVHLSDLGHPLIGDPVYGGIKPPTLTNKDLSNYLKDEMSKVKRQCLHAFILGFIHPKTKKEHYFESKIPEDFIKIQELIERTGQKLRDHVI